MIRITDDLILQGMSGNGGWTREQLKLLGVKWPPVKGWRKSVIGRPISEQDAEHFVRLRGMTLKRLRHEGQTHLTRLLLEVDADP